MFERENKSHNFETEHLQPHKLLDLSMQAKPHTLIYIATIAAESSRKKAVQEAKQLQGEIQQYLAPHNPIEVVIEGKEDQPYGYELLSGQTEGPSIKVLHLVASSRITKRWYLNTTTGRRKALEGESLQFDHLSQLQVVILEGGASLHSIEQLLFAGIPQVLAIAPREEQGQSQKFIQQWYQTLLKGGTYQQAFIEASSLFPEKFRFQEIPSDPFEYWEVKGEWEQHQAFPEGLYYLSTTQDILHVSLATGKTESVEAAPLTPIPSQPTLYFCTQELRGKPTGWNLSGARLAETAAIEHHAQYWNTLFSNTSGSATIQPTEEVEESVASRLPAIDQANFPSETESRLSSADPEVVSSSSRNTGSQNEEDWVDELMTQYRRRFTLSLAPSYRKGMALLSLSVMLLAVISVLTWKQFSPPIIPDTALPNDLYTQASAFSSRQTFNILLLPFRSYADCAVTEHIIETAVRDRLTQLHESEILGIRVAFLNNGNCPENDEEARKLARTHKADVVIWGDYRKPNDSDEQVNLRYISMEERYSEVSIWLGQHIGKQALSEDLNRGTFYGDSEDIVYWILGLSYLHKEAYQSALSYLNEIELDQHPDRSIVQHMIGKCYQGLRLEDRALEAYNEALCLDPDNEGAYHSRGRYYQKERRIDLAIQDYDEVLRITPQHAKAKLLSKMLRENFAQEGSDPRELERTVTQQLVPNLDTNALLAEAERSPSPLPSPQEILDQEPKRENISTVLAQKEAELAAERRRIQREKMQQLVVAIQEYTEFIRQYPDKASLYHQRGVAYEMLKQHDEAIADFSHALRLDPGMRPAYLDRGSLYVANGQMEKALGDFNEALRLSPEDPDLYAVRAELLRKLGRYASAEEDARRAITLDPGNRRYQRLLGRISEELTSY